MPGSTTGSKRRRAREIDELPPPRSWVVAPGQIRKFTMGTFNRTPITELLHSAHWMGDVTPWSTASVSRDDVPSWVNGSKPRRTPRERSVGLLVAACSVVLILSSLLFAARA